VGSRAKVFILFLNREAYVKEIRGGWMRKWRKVRTFGVGLL